jgi:hypothetical protein
MRARGTLTVSVAEGADQLALAATVAIALPRAVAAAVAEAAEKRRQLLVEQRLDGRAHVSRSRSSIGSPGLAQQ